MEPGMESTILAAVVALIIGFFLGRRMAPGSQETRELEGKLDEAKAHQERYETRVNAHFADTASKLNALTQNYRDVYEHLANGATDLCSQDGAAQFNALAAPAAQEAPEDTVIEQESVVVEAPRDYAPKTSPDDPGVLNERFGLEDGEDKPPEEASKRED